MDAFKQEHVNILKEGSQREADLAGKLKTAQGEIESKTKQLKEAEDRYNALNDKY